MMSVVALLFNLDLLAADEFFEDAAYCRTGQPEQCLGFGDDFGLADGQILEFHVIIFSQTDLPLSPMNAIFEKNCFSRFGRGRWGRRNGFRSNKADSKPDMLIFTSSSNPFETTLRQPIAKPSMRHARLIVCLAPPRKSVIEFPRSCARFCAYDATFLDEISQHIL